MSNPYEQIGKLTSQLNRAKKNLEFIQSVTKESNSFLSGYCQSALEHLVDVSEIVEVQPPKVLQDEEFEYKYLKINYRAAVLMFKCNELAFKGWVLMPVTNAYLSKRYKTYILIFKRKKNE